MQMMGDYVAVDDVMIRSGVAFGTSGARGLVEAMTDQVCFTYTCAFLQHLETIGQFSEGKPVAIAGDLRPSTARIMAACAAAIRHKGGLVAYCGYVPSPAVARYGFVHGHPSLMVTGSHIPDDRNGIKFNRADGEILKPDELAIRAQTVLLPNIFDDHGMLVQDVDCGPLIDVATAYTARYVDFFGTEALTGLKLGIYEHSAVGRDLLVAIVEKLGGEAVRLGRSERFIPVDTEAVRPEDQVLAKQWAVEHNLDAILSTDGDSDRPLLADEAGSWLRGDLLGILCAQALNIEAVAVPVSCNTALEQTGSFKQVRRTRIGSPFVIEAMNELLHDWATVCGFEANGGFLLATAVEDGGRHLPALPTRDAVLPMIAVLTQARRQGVSLSQLQEGLPDRYTYSERLKDFSTAHSQALLASLQEGSGSAVLARLSEMFGALAGAATSFDVTDGLRISFDGGDIIHLRPSGNAPELRCYTESATAERAAWLNDKVLELLAQQVAA
jgi:phosphomannomutase